MLLFCVKETGALIKKGGHFISTMLSEVKLVTIVYGLDSCEMMTQIIEMSC